MKVRVFDKPQEFDRFRDRLTEYAYMSRQLSVDYIDVDKQPVRGEPEPGADRTARSSSTTRAAPSE